MKDSSLLGKLVAAFGVCLLSVALVAAIGGTAHGCVGCDADCPGALIGTNPDPDAFCSVFACPYAPYSCNSCTCHPNRLGLACECAHA